jgi:predicted phosphohydrolase
MALYAIGDLHLSLSVNKSMEVFGPAWKDYVSRIEESLSILTEDDVLILAGDTSWGMNLNEAEADFRFLDRFPGKKYLIKGNHDYWWVTAAKLHRFFEEKEIRTLDILHNNCEHFVNECAFGEHNSEFLSSVRNKLRKKLGK